MGIVPQTIPINFSQGLETKTDPKQIAVGKFLSLVNSVFTVGNRLTKRNGFKSLPKLPDATSVYCTTFNGDLTAIGSNLEAYSSSNKSWVNRGAINPVSLGVMPLIRNNLNQVQADSAVSPNGLICTVYTEVNAGVNAYKYAVADSNTGQNIISPTVISDADPLLGTPRVFALASYFIIVYTNKVSSTYSIKYIAISSTSLVANTSATIAASYTPSSTLSWDGIVANNALYVSYNGASGGGMKITYLTASLAVASAVALSSAVGTLVSVCADTFDSVIWVSFYDSASGNFFAAPKDYNLNSIVIALTPLGGYGTILNIASVASHGVLTIFLETQNFYSYDNNIPTNFVQRVTATVSGLGAQKTIARSVGLASKAFIIGTTAYALSSYSSPFQPTYFLIDSNGNVVSRLAYENGGGYLTTGLPSISLDGTTVRIAYLFKDLIAASNKGTALPVGTPINSVYSQTGINLVNFNLSTQDVLTAEIGSNLNLTGGFLWGYDGYVPTENNFFLWPDSIEVSTSGSAVTPTGTVTISTNVVTAVSSTAGIGIGASITGTAIPANQFVTGVTSNTITFGPLTATASHTAETITVTGNVNVAQVYYYQVTYEWTDNQGNAFRSAPSVPITVTTTGTTSTNTVHIPTLRLTYKTANPVKIVVYRWSAAQQVYYQVTSLTAPLLNATTSDQVTFFDASPDTSILGNNILYTTGGTLEDVGAPASSVMTLFDDRLWLVDAEDPNLLWFSKQVIEATPVEMSDDLTVYVAPTLGSQGSTGPITALGAMDDKLIIFKANAIYYMNGTGPDNTGENSQYSQPIFITSTVGCANPASVVFTPNGLMFQSDKGIWLLGRDLSTDYIGAPVEAFNAAVAQSSVNVPGTNQVRFTLDSGITLMYDYYYGQWGTFTTSARSSTLYQGLHTYINDLGQVFQESPGTYLDGSSPVLLGFLTGHIQLSGISGYQRLWELQILGQYFSPHLLNFQIGYDFGPLSEQALIQPTNYTGNYGSDQIYGQTSPYGGGGTLEQWRIQPSQELCQAFQISVQEVFDPSFGTQAGAGFTLSAMTCVLGILRGYRPVKATNTAGSI